MAPSIKRTNHASAISAIAEISMRAATSSTRHCAQRSSSGRPPQRHQAPQPSVIQRRQSKAQTAGPSQPFQFTQKTRERRVLKAHPITDKSLLAQGTPRLLDISVQHRQFTGT
jgi:hypothetical protein